MMKIINGKRQCPNTSGPIRTWPTCISNRLTGPHPNTKPSDPRTLTFQTDPPQGTSSNINVG